MASVFTYNIVFGGDGEIVGTGANNPANPEQAGKPNPNNPTTPKGGIKDLALLAAGGHLLSSGVGYITSRVEMFTGSSQKQQQVNMLMKGIGYMTAFAVNPTLGVATMAFDAVTSIIDYSHEMKWKNKQTEQTRARAGFEGLEMSR